MRTGATEPGGRPVMSFVPTERPEGSRDVTQDLRHLFEHELGAQMPPPLGSLVEDAVRDGRRLRRRRSVGTGGGGAAGALAVVAAVAMIGVPGLRGGGAPADIGAGAAATPPSSAAHPSAPASPAPSSSSPGCALRGVTGLSPTSTPSLIRCPPERQAYDL